MEFEIGHVVRSAAGHDRGDLFLIVGIDGDYLLLADGRTRKTEKPKRKKKKHVHREGVSASPAALRLRKGERAGNNEIRRALAVFGGQTGQEGGKTAWQRTI